MVVSPRKRSEAAGVARPRRARQAKLFHEAPESRQARDLNAEAASWLLDLAALQPSDSPRRLAYRRAARAVLGLPRSIATLFESGRLPKIPYIGESSEQVLREVAEEGTSPSVEHAIEESRLERQIVDLRRLREHFLSYQVVEAIIDADLPGVVSIADYRGDLQMHSTFSDGAQTLASIAEHCLSLHQQHAAVTDHSHGLPVARGMTLEVARRRNVEIDELNRVYEGRFLLLKGVETNILGDGTLDVTEEERREFEIVLASPHTGLRGQADQTARMLAAVTAPGVHILGHPTGRRYDTRSGVQARWDEVFAAAAERGVAIEIDGHPDRQDVPWPLAQQALKAGCVIALDSDAHDTPELPFYRYAIAHARLAGIPRDRVINTWSTERLLEWAAGHE